MQVCIFSPHHQTKLSVHACGCVNAPRTQSIAPRLVVEKHRRTLVSIPDTQVLQKLFRRCTRIHKMVDFLLTKGAAKATLVRSCPEKCQLGARNEPAVSSYLVLRRMSHGAICSINTPAVINTVLRRPMAWKRLGAGQREVGKVGALAVLTPLFQLPFCASHNT